MKEIVWGRGFAPSNTHVGTGALACAGGPQARLGGQSTQKQVLLLTLARRARSRSAKDDNEKGAPLHGAAEAAPFRNLTTPTTNYQLPTTVPCYDLSP